MDLLAKYLVEYQGVAGRMADIGVNVEPASKQSHLECVSRACLMGLATGTITFATLFLGQKHFTKQLKGMKTSNIALSSTLFSLTTTYLIVSAKLDDCNKAFRKRNTGKYNEQALVGYTAAAGRSP